MEKKGRRKERKEEREGYERRETEEAEGRERCLEMEMKQRGEVGELVNDLASCLVPVLCEPGASQVALVVKSLPASAGDIRDVSSIPGVGRSPGAGNGHPLQYSCLENPVDRGVWRAEVLRVAKSRTGHRITRIGYMEKERWEVMSKLRLER